MSKLAGGPKLRRLAWRTGRRIYMEARGEQSSGSITENGESFLQECVLRTLPPARPAVFLDIGANVGEWTTALLGALRKCGHSCEDFRVHAFEPVPATAELLRDTLRNVAGGERVQVHELALSSETGTARMSVLPGAGTNSLHLPRDAGDSVKTATVSLTTMAEFCRKQDIAHVHLAKCDTEGNDARVLAGAAPLLQARRIDVVQFEYNHRWIFARSFLKDVFDLTAQLPYTVARVDREHLTLFRQWNPELERFFQSNYALVLDSAVERFPTRDATLDPANTYA
jgi:FkbM family methyltransferase